MQKPPLADELSDNSGTVPTSWAVWFTNLWMVADSLNSSGLSAKRPMVGLYVGRNFFDTTLNKPIWLKSVRPSVWVDATGVAV